MADPSLESGGEAPVLRPMHYWAATAAALVVGGGLAKLLSVVTPANPMLAAAAIVAGAVTFGVINLWDAQNAARYDRLLAEDEALIERS